MTASARTNVPLRTRCRHVLTGTACAALLAPLIATADDLDVYSPRFDAGFKPTLLFMIDTSASNTFVENGNWSPWRRDRLLRPMIDFLSTARGVRVGLSTFNGSSRGGAVVRPADELDRDLCAVQDCSTISVRAPILHGSDDGHEDVATGHNILYRDFGHVAEVGNDPLRFNGIDLEDEADAAVETSGRAFHRSEVLPLFLDDAGDTTRIALRWPDVTALENAEFDQVYVQFAWHGDEHLDADAGEGDGQALARITLDRRAESPPLADVAGQRIQERPRTAGHVDWSVGRPSNWNVIDEEHYLYTPDLAPLIEEFRQATDSGPLTIIIEPQPGFPVDAINAVNALGVHERDARYIAPRLRLDYRLVGPAVDQEPRITGLRFDRLEVPPDVRITSAHLELAPAAWKRDTASVADLSIRAENSGDAQRFTAADHDMSGRSLTSAQVNWSPGSWFQKHDIRQRTPDLSALVQQVVDHDDWCAGNALALLIQGEGGRHMLYHEAGDLRAASLHVTYEPLPPGRTDHCRRQPDHAGLLLASEGDVVETPGGGLAAAGATFDTGAADAGRLAMRFKDVNLDPGADVSEALLTLSIVGHAEGRPYLQLSMDTDTPGAPFDPVAGLTARMAGEPVYEWFTDRLSPGDRITTIDLGPLVQQAVDAPDWQRGGDLVLTLQRHSNFPVVLATSASADVPGPRLRITERLHGATADALPLLTPRDLLIAGLRTLPSVGETPMVDAFYESAQYLLGGEVVHGTRRGEQQAINAVHRLSHPDTYTGGTVVRPGDCDPQDPDSPTCIDEQIQGPARYLAPPVGECRANQIVLVSDGEPTPGAGDTAARIRAMTGVAACEAAPGSEACAVDLARWLAAGDANREPIRVNTIGFDLQSDFLARVAAAGDGRSFQASSAGELVESLASISASAVHHASSFVAPSVAVSRYNRAAHRSEAFLGLFQPADTGRAWPGNLKRYGIGLLDDGTIGLLDAADEAAMDPQTGNFAATARSYWSVLADGADVARGGAASRLSSGRRVLTWPAASDGTVSGARPLVDFHEDNAAILAGDLGVSATLRDKAIRWARGRDVNDQDNDGQLDEARRQMGAAVHTTPVVIDYVSGEAVDSSVVFAGTQEGLLHALDTETGREHFAFLPHELYGNIGAFLQDTPGARRHGLDGPVSSWLSDENRNGAVDPGETALVFVGMRRGGSHYYALDVSDPDAPSIAWTIDPQRDGYAALGQSWSSLQSGYLPPDPDQGANAAVRPVLVFGNGYDAANDARGADDAAADRGAIFMADPRTGELIERIDAGDHAHLVHSMPADPTLVDLDLDGVLDLLIAADVGGNLWRVDIAPGAAPSLSHAARLADRPDAAADPGAPASASGDRRFFHSPDVALLGESGGATSLGVSIGSGRRDDPLGTQVTDRLYLLKLPAGTADGSALTHADLFDATDGTGSALPGQRGWYIDMERPGEKVLGTPVLVDGQLMVTSYVPPASAGDPCAPDRGTGRLYSLNVFSAEPARPPADPDGEPARSIELDRPGLPAPVSIVFSEERPGNPSVMVGTQALDVMAPRPVRERVYWVSE